MIQVTKRIPLSTFKTNNGNSAISVRKSKTSGKLYAVIADTEEYIGMVLPDFNKDLPIHIITFVDDDGSTWDCLGNYTPKEEYTL